LLCTGINVGSLFHCVYESQYCAACRGSGMPQMNKTLKLLRIICNYCTVHDLDCDENSMYLWLEVKCIIISITGANSNCVSSVNKRV
jgi:hypothetical protein